VIICCPIDNVYSLYSFRIFFHLQWADDIIHFDDAHEYFSLCVAFVLFLIIMRLQYV